MPGEAAVAIAIVFLSIITGTALAIDRFGWLPVVSVVMILAGGVGGVLLVRSTHKQVRRSPFDKIGIKTISEQLGIEDAKTEGTHEI